MKYILGQLKRNCEVPFRKNAVINEQKAIDSLDQWMNGCSWEEKTRVKESEREKRRKKEKSVREKLLEEIRNWVPNSKRCLAGELDIFERSSSGEYKCEDCEIVMKKKN